MRKTIKTHLFIWYVINRQLALTVSLLGRSARFQEQDRGISMSLRDSMVQRSEAIVISCINWAFAIF